MDLRKVKKLIELVEESAIEELEVASGDESIRIVMPRGISAAPGVPVGAVMTAQPATIAEHTPPAADAAVAFKAPMAGTFYSAPHPDAEPFVTAGQSVSAGEVLCIIESMKMMHEIRAAQDGTVVQICVSNGQPIGTGELLFKLS